jgi:hypothetical protein
MKRHNFVLAAFLPRQEGVFGRGGKLSLSTKGEWSHSGRLIPEKYVHRHNEVLGYGGNNEDESSFSTRRRTKAA